MRDCGHATLPAIVRATLPDTTAINIDENVSRDASVLASPLTQVIKIPAR